MAAKSYLSLIAGVRTLVAGVVVGGTATQDGALLALDANGRIDNSVLPVGIGADTFTSTAGEALAAGDLCYVTAAGTIMKAGAGAAGTVCQGFVLASSANSASATIYFEGRNTSLTGLTAGTRYYLSETAGGVTATPVTGTGKRHQFIGRAVSATSLDFEADDFIQL